MSGPTLCSREKESEFTNDASARFPDEADFIAVVRRIVDLSVETVRIVDSLPSAILESKGQPCGENA